MNGEGLTVMQPTRGIRQGDPLSPYLFIVLAGVLRRNRSQEAVGQRLKGLTLRRNCRKLHHLFFADDSLFFLQGLVENARRLKDLLDDYCNASEHRIHTAKSTIFFNVSALPNEIKELEEVLNMRGTNDPEKYLGLLFLWGR